MGTPLACPWFGFAPALAFLKGFDQRRQGGANGRRVSENDNVRIELAEDLAVALLRELRFDRDDRGEITELGKVLGKSKRTR